MGIIFNLTSIFTGIFEALLKKLRLFLQHSYLEFPAMKFDRKCLVILLRQLPDCFEFGKSCYALSFLLKGLTFLIESFFLLYILKISY